MSRAATVRGRRRARVLGALACAALLGIAISHGDRESTSSPGGAPAAPGANVIGPAAVPTFAVAPERSAPLPSSPSRSAGDPDEVAAEGGSALPVASSRLLTGRVVDDRGAPVPFATVVAEERPERFVVEADDPDAADALGEALASAMAIPAHRRSESTIQAVVADEHGCFSVPIAAASTPLVMAMLSRRHGDAVFAPPGVASLELRMARTGALRGAIVEIASAAPADHALLAAATGGRRGGRRQRRAARFEVILLDGAPAEWVVRRHGFRAARVRLERESTRVVMQREITVELRLTGELLAASSRSPVRLLLASAEPWLDRRVQAVETTCDSGGRAIARVGFDGRIDVRAWWRAADATEAAWELLEPVVIEGSSLSQPIELRRRS